MRRPLSLAISALLIAGPALAGGAGSTGASFLKVPVNGRAVGMAGAFTAATADLTTMEYNPAGLAGLRRGDFALTYIDYIENTSFQSAGFATPIGHAPDAPTDDETYERLRPVVGFQFRQFAAKDDARTELGVKTGDITIRDQLFHADAAIPLTSQISVGGGFKYISRHLDIESANGYAFDTGATWRGPSKLTAGVSILNIGSAMGFIDKKDPAPTLVRFGAARPFGAVLVALDATQGRDKVTRLAGGAEWSVGRFVKLRGGAFQQTSDLGFSAGLGVFLPGPLKTTPIARRRGAPAPAAATTSNTEDMVFNEKRAADLLDRLNALSIDLTERFERSGLQAHDYPLAVLPAAGAGGHVGSALGDLLSQQMQQAFPTVDGARVEAAMKDLGLPESMDDDQAARLGRMLGVRAVVIQQLTGSRDNYSLHDRIVLVDTGNAVSAASTSLPSDVFRGGRKTLSPVAQPSTTAVSNRNTDRVDWGLDYGLTSRADFGLTHTITLRILY